MQQVVKYSSLPSYMLKPPSLLTQGFNKNKKAQEISSSICVVLRHRKSEGTGEEPPVPILMLISAMINTVWSIQPLWTAFQVT